MLIPSKFFRFHSRSICPGAVHSSPIKNMIGQGTRKALDQINQTYCPEIITSAALSCYLNVLATSFVDLQHS